MQIKQRLLETLLSVGLRSAISGVAVAQMPSPVHSSEQTNQFRRIDQPLGVKIGVTLGGLALIGLELWWFLLSQQRLSQQAEKSDD